MKLEPKALLFDMDGVLVNSIKSWYYSLNEALKTYGKKQVTLEEFEKKFWGRDLQYNLEHMNLSYEILSFCNNIYGDNVGHVEIYPDTINTLEKLDGYNKAVITNTPRTCTNQIIKKYGFNRFFNFFLTSDDVKRGKPSPEIVFMAIKKLDLKPDDVILIGDTKSDIEAGQKAGVKVVGMRINADYRVEKMSDLLNLINI